MVEGPDGTVQKVAHGTEVWSLHEIKFVDPQTRVQAVFSPFEFLGQQLQEHDS